MLMNMGVWIFTFSFLLYYPRMLSSEPQSARRLPMEQLSLLVGMNVLGLTLSLLLVLPERTYELTFLGTEANVVFSGPWLFALLLSVMTAAGVESIMRSHPRVHLSETPYTAIMWILPCLLVAGTCLILPLFRESAAFAVFTILTAGLLLGLVVLGEYLTVDLRDPAYAFARLGLNLAVLLAALASFQTIYGFKLRSILSAPLIGIAAGLLALELLRASESDLRRTWVYAIVIGAGLGEALWALNYWNVTALLGGVVLLILFYLVTGLAQQYLFGKLNWRTLVEFAVVVAIVSFIVLQRVG
jgi:hypothetical protein